MYLLSNAWVSRTQLGDYGYFSGSGDFGRRGNVFADIKSLIPEADAIPRRQVMTMAGQGSSLVVVDDRGLSLPTNQVFNSSLASLSPRLIDAYLVTRVVQCRQSKS